MIDWAAIWLTSEWRSLSMAAVDKMARAVHRFAEFDYPEGIRLAAEGAELFKRAQEIQARLELFKRAQARLEEPG